MKKDENIKEPKVQNNRFFSQDFTFGYNIKNKESCLDLIFWVRCSIGLGIGIFDGIMGLSGLISLFGSILMIIGLSKLYIVGVIKDNTAFLNEQELLLEGLPNSIGLFLLSWITIFTFF